MSDSKIRCNPCPRCGPCPGISCYINDIPGGALRTHCECEKCGLRAAGVILTAGSIARSPDADIVNKSAVKDWNQMVARLRERGEI